MDMEIAEVAVVAVAAVPSILSGVALLFINRGFKRNDAREEARKKEEAEKDQLRRKENILLLKNVDAVGCLAYQTARCIKGEKPNGDLDKALEYREIQKHALEDHLMEVNAGANH